MRTTLPKWRVCPLVGWGVLVQSPKSVVQSPKSMVQCRLIRRLESVLRIWTLGDTTLDSGLWTQDFGLRTLDSGLPTPDDATAFEMERTGEKLFDDPGVGGDVAGGVGKGVVAAKEGHPDHEIIGGVEIHCTTAVYCVL